MQKRKVRREKNSAKEATTTWLCPKYLLEAVKACKLHQGTILLLCMEVEGPHTKHHKQGLMERDNMPSGKIKQHKEVRQQRICIGAV
jgi:hypothetical protein